MRYFKTLIPSDFWFRTLLLTLLLIGLLIFWSLSDTNAFQNREITKLFTIAVPILLLLTAFDFYRRRSYKVGYSDHAIYWRCVGVKRRGSGETVIPFAEIIDVFGEPGSLGIHPFEAAIIRTDAPEAGDIVLSRLYLRDGDLRELLSKVFEMSNVSQTEEIREFLLNE